MSRNSRNVKELSKEQIKEIAINEVEEIGFEFIDIKNLAHPEDDYLKYVIGYSSNKEEFGVWLLNLELGGLHRGDYFSHWYSSKEEAFESAWNNFLERGE